MMWSIKNKKNRVSEMRTIVNSLTRLGDMHLYFD